MSNPEISVSYHLSFPNFLFTEGKKVLEKLEREETKLSTSLNLRLPISFFRERSRMHCEIVFLFISCFKSKTITEHVCDWCDRRNFRCSIVQHSRFQLINIASWIFESHKIIRLKCCTEIISFANAILHFYCQPQRIALKSHPSWDFSDVRVRCWYS